MHYNLNLEKIGKVFIGSFLLSASVKKEQFELLCKDGTRRSVEEYKICNWGTVPSRAIVTSSATNFEIRRMYQRFLEKAVRILHRNKNDTSSFNRLDNDQGGFENRAGYKFGENDLNRGGYNNPNEYSTDTWDRNGYDRRYGGGDNGLNSWDKPMINDTYDYYNRDHTEPTNVHPIEVFDLYESAPRYGTQHNLIFSVMHFNS
jgi:hypothetical protein